MRKLFNAVFRLFKHAKPETTEECTQEVKDKPQSEFRAEIDALEQVSEMTLEQITSCRKDVNVMWKVIFAKYVWQMYFQTGINDKIAEVLKVHRTCVCHYIFHYKQSENFLKNYDRYLKLL